MAPSSVVSAYIVALICSTSPAWALKSVQSGIGGILQSSTRLESAVGLESKRLSLRGGGLNFNVCGGRWGAVGDLNSDDDQAGSFFDSNVHFVSSSSNTLKEGWLLKKNRFWSSWSRVYCVVSADGLLTYYKDGKRSCRDGCVILSPGMLSSVGNEIHIRVNGQELSTGGLKIRGFSGKPEFVFSTLDDRDVQDWCLAIEDASTMLGRGKGLADLDIKGVERWIGEQLQVIKQRLGTFDADHIKRKFSENLVDGSSLHKLTNEDLREMGVRQIGVRINLLSAITTAQEQGRNLFHIEDSSRTAKSNATAQQEETSSKAASSVPRDSIKGTTTDSTRTSSVWPIQATAQAILRSFVQFPQESGTKGGTASSSDPNSNALEAMVDAAKGAYGAVARPQQQGDGSATTAATQGGLAAEQSNTSVGAGGTPNGANASNTANNNNIGDGTLGVNANYSAVLGSERVEGAGGNVSAVLGEGKPIEGWLWKKSGWMFRRWRKRWFVLEAKGPHGPRLRYHRDKSGGRRSYTVYIPLRGCDVSSKGQGSKDFTLTLPSTARVRHRTYNLQAPSSEVVASWTQGIAAAASAASAQ